jgi:anti-sigma B factor antagonist
MELQLRIYESGGATVVAVSGDIELHSAPKLREELRHVCELENPCCVVDMSGVPFIDSTGVGVLVGALKRAREHGGNLTIACPQVRVRRVFEITGLLGALPIYDSVEVAQSSCSLELSGAGTLSA